MGILEKRGWFRMQRGQYMGGKRIRDVSYGRRSMKYKILLKTAKKHRSFQIIMFPRSISKRNYWRKQLQHCCNKVAISIQHFVNFCRFSWIIMKEKLWGLAATATVWRHVVVKLSEFKSLWFYCNEIVKLQLDFEKPLVSLFASRKNFIRNR